MKKFITLTLSLTALAAALSSCSGGADTLNTLSAPQASKPEQVNLSPEGKQALLTLRKGSPHYLTENDYLNKVTTRPLPVNHNERQNAAEGQMRWAHRWAQETFSALRTPVNAQWISAFVADGALSKEGLVHSCQTDGDQPLTCASALKTASHAAVERLPDGNWLVVLAKFDTPLTITPVVIYY